MLIAERDRDAARTSRARSASPWKGDLAFRTGDLLIFVRDGHVARFADYRGEGRFEGVERPIARFDRDDAVFRVRSLVIRPRRPPELSPVLHRLADDRGEVVLGGLARRDHEQPLLLDRALDEGVDVGVVVAELAHAARRADVAHQVGEHLRQRVLVGVGQLAARDQLGRAAVLVGSAS